MDKTTAAKKEAPMRTPVAVIEAEGEVAVSDLRALTDGIAALDRLGVDLDRCQAALGRGADPDRTADRAG